MRVVATPAADKEAIEQAVIRGSELLKTGKLEEAQKAFRAALLLDPDNARVLALLGLAHFRGNQFDQARAIYEELVERAPTDASHRLNLGLVYLKIGDGARAINSLEASRALDPSQGRAVSYLGLAYARAGRYAEAYRSFLLAGQNELASEIESNLTAAERDGIHSQLQRSGLDVRPAAVKPPSPDELRTTGLGVPTAVVNEAVTARATTDEAPSRPTPPPDRDRPRTTPPFPPPGGRTPTPPSVVSIDPAAPLPMANDPNAPRMTESLQFVLPTRVGPPTASISDALKTATPSNPSIALPRDTRASQPPIPLSQLATEELVRPDDGDDVFEVAASGALVIRVAGKILTRLDGVHVTGGDLAFEPAMRRSRGHLTEEKFDHGGTQLQVVSGQGYLIAVPGKRAFTAVMLDDDIFYLREDLVFAFEASLRWENGNVPGLRGRLPVVQFRGDGAVALRTETQLVRVKLPPQGIVFVDAARLAGWIGRVIPRAVVPPSGGPMGDVCVECTGEGVVLVDATAGAPAIQIVAQAEAKAPERHTPPPPPSIPAAPIELDAAKSNWLDDDAPSEPGRDEI